MAKRPPPSDVSQNNGRNEYIPAFISKKPFYAGDQTEEDYLEHQRLQSASQDTLDKAKWYDRGRKTGPAATKFRKGACENCGAMSHKTKECLSRPRKQGAKWTGRNIQADEVVEDVKLGWDAKRDRWNGYDSREYSAVLKEYEELEAIKKAASASGQQPLLENGDDDGVNKDKDSDARYDAETDMGRSQPTSTRQLRLREDTAKYLLNLDLESARYDPKTRSMDTSTQNLEDAEDGFVRPASDAAEFERAQKYAWETQENAVTGTQKLHLQANPTEGEVLRKKLTAEAAEKRAARQKLLLDKYGASPSATISGTQQKLLQENERYVEYDESGAIKGEKAAAGVARSKYPEDVHPNNHTSAFGSWWADFKWGYACCHSFVRNSYCTGEEGKVAFEGAERLRLGDLEIEKEQEKENEDEGRPDERANEKDPEPAAKKRTLQEMREGITEEELEGYKRSRITAADPMAKLLGRDELVD